MEQRRKDTGNGPPTWVKPMVKSFWENRISPFEFGRFIGHNKSSKLLGKYARMRYGEKDEFKGQSLENFYY